MIEHPAYRKLLAASNELDKIDSNHTDAVKTAEIVSNAKALVRGSIEVLLERDPLKQRLGVISLMIIESTEYKVEKIDGKLVEVAEITDDYLFSWAIRELHTLPNRY